MKSKPFILMLSLIFLVSCSAGPNYRRPAVEVPMKWNAAYEGGITPAAVKVTAWWKTFNDEQLNSLIKRAVAANLDLRQAQARVREARAARSYTTADFFPAVNAQTSYKWERPSENAPRTLGAGAARTTDYDLYEAGFDAAWEVDVFGSKRRAYEAANADMAAREDEQRNVLVIVLSEVARNYLEVRGFQRRLEIARDNIKLQQDALDITSARYESGLTSHLDVAQATALLSSTQAQVPVLETALFAAMHRLSVLLAQPPGALVKELSQSTPIPAAPPQVPVGLPSDLLRRRPDIRSAERELAAATARIGVAVSDLFPKFYLTGVTGVQSISASDWFTGGSKFWSAGPTVQWKILDAARIQANIRVQNARQEEALARYEQTVLNSFEDVENALVAYAKEQVRYRSLKQAAEADRLAFQLAHELYTKGLSNYLNVLDAQRSLYGAEDQLVQSERTLSSNVIALYKALGGGWQDAAGVKENG